VKLRAVTIKTGEKKNTENLKIDANPRLAFKLIKIASCINGYYNGLNGYWYQQTVLKGIPETIL